MPNGVISKAWTEVDKILIFQAFARRAGSNGTFVSLVCGAGPVQMARLTGSRYGGWHYTAGSVAMYDLGLGNLNNTEYTLIHELGHVIDARNDKLRQRFTTVLRNPRCMTYPFPSMCGPSEAFAESVVLAVVYKTKYFSAYDGIYDFPTRDPQEYAWIRDTIFGGQEF
jgi:hypothetical protein